MMVREKTVAYVEKALAKGKGEDSIRERLVKIGLGTADIDHAFREVARKRNAKWPAGSRSAKYLHSLVPVVVLVLSLMCPALSYFVQPAFAVFGMLLTIPLVLGHPRWKAYVAVSIALNSLVILSQLPGLALPSHGNGLGQDYRPEALLEGCRHKASEEEIYACIISTARQRLDLRLCDVILDSGQRRLCFSELCGRNGSDPTT